MTNPAAWIAGRIKASGVSLKTLRKQTPDVLASVPSAVSNVPDGMAASVIIGVGPIAGLYASAFGPIIGGLTSRTSLMVITTTSASALAASEVLKDEGVEVKLSALLLLTLLAGLFQFSASLLGLARLTSFVSHSVMTGFMTGIAALIILGQLGTLVGFEPEGANAVLKAVDVIAHVTDWDLATAIVGVLTILLIILTTRLGLRSTGPLLAIGVPTVLAAIVALDDVATVKDVSEIPAEIPLPALPDFSLLSVELVTGALALAAIIFVQTAGVSQGMPGQNGPGGQARDLAASGLANVGSALFQGQPVGGSLGSSILNVQAGARSRLATVLSGVWIIVVILLLSGLVELIPMTSLAALLLVAGVAAVDVPEAASIWRTGWISRLTILTTFVLTLLLPIQIAVGLGVVLSAALHLASASSDVELREVTRLPDGRLEERDPSTTAASESVTVLQVYGSLFYAGARTLARNLPDPENTTRPVVLLRLRGKTRFGATAIDVLSDYDTRLRDREGRLYLEGLDPDVLRQVESSGKLAGVHLLAAEPVVGASLSRAYDEAHAWLEEGSRVDEHGQAE